MRCILLVFLSFVALARADSQSDIEEWNAYKLKYGKSYNNLAKQDVRFNIYKANKQKIAEHNKLYEAGKVSFQMGVNQFTDLLLEEYVNLMGNIENDTLSNGENNGGLVVSRILERATVNSIDWRTKGAVTPIKNQKKCGSCWAFSATGALEGQHYRKTGKLVSLSEQNLIDCSGQGCGGGSSAAAYNYIKNNGGINTEAAYPYKATNGAKCLFNRNQIAATVTGYAQLPFGDEQQLKAAVTNIGPIAVSIDASHASFQNYRSGILNEPKCSSTSLGHAVLVVGFGTDAKGNDYWLVKNSWGTSWGDQGYIKMSRNKANHCGIATRARYPSV